VSQTPQTPKGNNTKATKNVENKEKTTMEENIRNPRADETLIGRKSRSQTLPFLLTFEIFNRNVHNCLIDSGASSNVMPYSVCKKLNLEPQIIKTKIIQLD
jgi:predicted aspartyl protease